MDINLLKILSKYWADYNKKYPEVILDTTFVYAVLIASMKEACDKTVDLCANSAELGSYEFKEDWVEEPFNCTIDDRGNIHAIDKTSILQIKNYIQ